MEYYLFIYLFSIFYIRVCIVVIQTKEQIIIIIAFIRK